MPDKEQAIVSAFAARDSYKRWRTIDSNEIVGQPDWNTAVGATELRSIIVPEKLHNLYLLIRDFIDALESQDIVEFGSYRGGSALLMGSLLKQHHPAAHLWALDTFEGMPETGELDAHVAGDFQDADLPGFKHLIQHNRLQITTLKGLCQDTFPSLAEKRFAIAHIDLDIYSACKYAAEAAWEQLVPGGFLVFDDANAPSCYGATRAAEEFMLAHRVHSEQVWPHWVYRKTLQPS